MRRHRIRKARALVELLLDAGADPNDEQALYNVHFLRDEEWLELLLARGLREQALLDYPLGESVKQEFADRVALLLAHGASPNGRDFYNERANLENPLLMGHALIAKMIRGRRSHHFPQARSSGSRVWAATKTRYGM